jgi:hypothetical protein
LLFYFLGVLDLALLVTAIKLGQQIRREVDPTYAGDRSVFTLDGSGIVAEHQKRFPASRKRVIFMAATAGSLLLLPVMALTIH